MGVYSNGRLESYIVLQREKSLHVIINFSIRAKDEIEGWRLFGDKMVVGKVVAHLCLTLII